MDDDMRIGAWAFNAFVRAKDSAEALPYSFYSRIVVAYLTREAQGYRWKERRAISTLASDGQPSLFSIALPKFSLINLEFHHRGAVSHDSGPAIVHDVSTRSAWREKDLWGLNGKVLRKDAVESWMLENDLPHWLDWTDEHRLLFRMRFG